YYSSNNNTLSNNTVNSNNWWGIYLYYSSNNTLSNNTANSNNQYGIYLYYSSNNNTLSNNTVNSNNDYGIYLYVSSNNNTIANNTISNNDYGIYLYVSSNNNTIANNTISNNDYGIFLKYSSYNIISRNNASNNYIGINLYYSNYNTLSNNTANSNNQYGIYLYYSNCNTLSNNTALNNDYGIYLYSSSNNTISNNTVNLNNWYGIYLYSSSNNTIHNNYFDNMNNAYDNGNNIWNVSKTSGTNIIGGPYLGGNYWSDYTDHDLDGDEFGDKPYNISGGTNKDYLPLIGLTTTSLFAPLASYTDWQPQDYNNSEAIKTVKLEGGRLVLDTHFVGGHANYSKGEVFLNLRYVLGLEDQTPIDLTDHEITVEVSVPEEFVGWTSRPNGVQVFVKDVFIKDDKDEEWRNQYGEWVNIEEGGKHHASLSPTTIADFNSTKIIILGVKFGIGTGSSYTYDGPLYVDNIRIYPPLNLTPPPLLPESTPCPISFTVGGNWRIMEYGQNFGNTSWFPSGNGVSKHVNFVSTYFDYFQRSGITEVRVFLLTDGRTMFDRDGHVVGYNEIFREDVQTFLDLADEHGIKVEFVIVDYLIAGKAEFVNGVWVRGRGEIITNESLKTEFMNEFLTPFLIDFGDHPAIIGFDVINEPEWVISREDGGDWEAFNDSKIKPDSPIPGQKMKDFITDCINTIRGESPGKPITVGISCPYVNFVNDLDVDYIALHHYPWMDEREDYNKLEDYLSLLPEGKQWALEEFPSHNTSIGVTEYLDRVLTEGGNGAMLWNLKPESDNSTMHWERRDGVLLELRQWVDENGPFDTGALENPYPSISGTHNGTITPSNNITINKMYTYPCAGTGGHTESVKIWNSTWNTTATWSGYTGDYHNITFDSFFVLISGETYNYTIITGSYPQIVHEKVFNATRGTITCTEFIDLNGKRYDDKIPAIRLERIYNLAVEDIPELAVSTSLLDFGSVEKGYKGNMTLEIWNDGGETLFYSLETTCDWCSISPTNGTSTGEHDTINVSIDTLALSRNSSYSVPVQISSNGGNGSVLVNVSIEGEPELAVSTSLLDFGSVEKGYKGNMTLEIWNDGGETLFYSLETTCDWCSISPTNGTSTGEHDTINVSIDTLALSRNSSYSVPVQISSNGGNGSVLVNVSIKIFGSCLDAVFSPYGNVALYSKAYSPDGKMYAHVNESTRYGEIGIFNCTTDELIKVIKVTQVPSASDSNPIKGLAWSPDSNWIAAMYHHWWPYSSGHISIADLEEEKEIIRIYKEYRYMVFSADGTKIFASLNGSEVGFDVIDIP
ncbi:NosD domain-containing protein, partial [Halobacteriota archaeon]